MVTEDRWSLSLVTPPAIEPYSLEEAKLHLKVDITDEDSMITSLIKATRQAGENYMGRRLMTSTWDLKLDYFPSWAIDIPYPPLISVTSVNYRDDAGVLQTVPTTDYSIDVNAGPLARPGLITPLFSKISVWPTTEYRRMNAVTIRYVAGYGPAATDVPEDIVAGMKILLTHLWRNRGDAAIPQAALACWWPYVVEPGV